MNSIHAFRAFYSNAFNSFSDASFKIIGASPSNHYLQLLITKIKTILNQLIQLITGSKGGLYKPLKLYGAQLTQGLYLTHLIEQAEQFSPRIHLPSLISQSQSPLTSLSFNTQIQIAQYLGLKEIVVLRRVNKSLRTQTSYTLEAQLKKLTCLNKEQSLIHFYTLRYYFRIDRDLTYTLNHFIQAIASTAQLSLTDLAVDDSHIQKLALNCQSITALDLSYCIKLTDKTLDAIQESFPNLQTINIVGCYRLTSTRFVAFCRARPKVLHGFYPILNQDNEDGLIQHAFKLGARSVPAYLKASKQQKQFPSRRHELLLEKAYQSFTQERAEALGQYKKNIEQSLLHKRLIEEMNKSIESEHLAAQSKSTEIIKRIETATVSLMESAKYLVAAEKKINGADKKVHTHFTKLLTVGFNKDCDLAQADDEIKQATANIKDAFHKFLDASNELRISLNIKVDDAYKKTVDNTKRGAACIKLDEISKKMLALNARIRTLSKKISNARENS